MQGVVRPCFREARGDVVFGVSKVVTDDVQGPTERGRCGFRRLEGGDRHVEVTLWRRGFFEGLKVATVLRGDRAAIRIQRRCGFRRFEGGDSRSRDTLGSAFARW